MSDRPKREMEIDGRRWLLVDAWRSPGGRGLGYFVCVRCEEPTPGTADRRVILPGGRSLEEIDEQELRDLWERAAPLTASERRFEDEDGDLWLAQATGPVWSEDGATDATGFRLACLTRDRPLVEVRRHPLCDLRDDDLAALVARPPS